MQVVFVHGVNSRDSGDGTYQQTVAVRDDRFRRLAFGANATIHNPYWGQFGLPGKRLASFPLFRDALQALGIDESHLPDEEFLGLARQNFSALIASLSVAAIGAAESARENERHAVEDYWMEAIAYAEARGAPAWLDGVASAAEFADRLDAEVEVALKCRSLGTGWLPGIPRYDFNAVGAAGARQAAAGFLAQFLGDALMFFSRRDQGAAVREEVANHIVVAATAAAQNSEPLVLIGHSMGGAVLHEILSDPDQIAAVEDQLSQKLTVDLFLSVGTQIGLFAELNLFPAASGKLVPAVPISNYWNVYDYTDPLAYLCGPLIDGSVDFEINTAAGIFGSHSAYFENAQFFTRMKARLGNAGIIN